LKALEYLHKAGIVHRDIKGQNILMTDEGDVRLIDFGVSAQMKERQTKRNTFIGTPYWMAPEVIATDQQDDAWYDQRSDIWSLGITAIEIADGEPPLSDVHPMRALFLIPRNKPPQLPDRKKWSKTVNDFVAVCLEKDFLKRPTSTALMKHAFLTKVPRSAKQSMAELIDRHREAGGRQSSVAADEVDGDTLGADNETRSLGSELSVMGGGLSYENADASADVDTLSRTSSEARSHTPMQKMSRTQPSSASIAQLGLAGSTGDTKEGAIRPRTATGAAVLGGGSGGDGGSSLRGSASKTSLGDVLDTGTGKAPTAGPVKWGFGGGSSGPSGGGGGGGGGMLASMQNAAATADGGGGAAAAVSTPKAPMQAGYGVSPTASPAVAIPGFGNYGVQQHTEAASAQQSPLPTPSTMTKMPEIRKFKRAFKSEILCASFWHQNLVVGTNSGLLLLDRSEEGKVHPLISRRRFKKIDVMPETGVVVTISGKKDKLRAYSLLWFRQMAQDKKLAKNYQQFTPVGDIERCTHYQVARYERMHFLCVAHDQNVSVFLWAPAPYSRFMVFKEFRVPQKPIKVNLSVGEDESLRLFYATSTGFFSIDVSSGSVLNLYRPSLDSRLLGAKWMDRDAIRPHEIIHVPDDSGGVKTLLLFDQSGVMIDKFGDIESELPFDWGELPTSIALATRTSVLGWGAKSIEIRSCASGVQEGVFKHKRATRLTYLCARGNKVFFASIKSSSDCQVYFMVF
jgi:hypothetical protein